MPDSPPGGIWDAALFFGLVRKVGGSGLAYVMEDQVDAHLRSGHLVRVWEDWCPPFPGYHPYRPNRRRPLAAFTLLLDTLRIRSRT